MTQSAQSFIPQAAAVCLVDSRIVLVSNSSRSRWVLPKGHCETTDPNETVCAMREAWEEAGVKCTEQSESLGIYVYQKNRGIYRVSVFLFRHCSLSNTWPESGKRTRLLVKPGDAVSLVFEPELKTILKNLDPVIF